VPALASNLDQAVQWRRPMIRSELVMSMEVGPGLMLRTVSTGSRPRLNDNPDRVN